MNRNDDSVWAMRFKMNTHYLSFIKIICTDLLCWIYFVPLCSGSGDESLSLYKCQQAEKNKTKVFWDNVILLKLIS